MRFLVDENVPQTLIKELKKKHHDVLDIKRSSYHQATDAQLVEIAYTENRIIITYDKDFLETEAIKKSVPKIIIRLPYPDLSIARKRLEQALDKYPLQKAVVTIYPDRDEVQMFGNTFS